ncbi:DNA repair helicase (rad3) [Edhazardia aedis USNM 41457]|uniref:DNA 5'-3' helicase n=1 Tax=Edhazardia aedis (strain USNM 41457) TaxID=1003232 RepID=J9DJ02_EDHAE|nr:DNA repair helicase (rad3) [Edhazardia aedis USNM 41457]|eukprot:EJW01367.1 DNA repair helicase (rad3) [Edhazardia aedis USNM 41457]
MKVVINEITVYFPFPTMYPEQHEYISEVLSLLKTQGHCLLEMPSGTGKTISLLSSIISYILHLKENFRTVQTECNTDITSSALNKRAKISKNKTDLSAVQNCYETEIYCEKNDFVTRNISNLDSSFSRAIPKIMYGSRTVGEIEKALEELKFLINYIENEYKIDMSDFLGVGLTSRNVLCVNENARKMPFSIEHACNRLTNAEDPKQGCKYFQNLEDLGSNFTSLNSIKLKKNCNEINCADKCQNYSVDDGEGKNIMGNSMSNEQTSFDLKANFCGYKPLNGVYTLADLVTLGKTKNICPYFLARKILASSDIIIFTYNYLIDPRIKSIVLKEIGLNSIVIFDEAHNIDNACIEAMSVDIKRSDLENANKEIKALELEIQKARAESIEILREEAEKIKTEKLHYVEGSVPYNSNLLDSYYEKLCNSKNMKTEQNNKNKKHIGFDVNDDVKNDSILSINNNEKNLEINENKNNDKTNFYNINDEKNAKKQEGLDFFNLNYEFAPGNIRNSIHFLSTLKRLTEYFKTKLKTTHLTTETTSSFCKSIKDLTLIDKKTLSFLSTRLSLLIRTLNLNGKIELSAIKKLCDFGSIAAQYQNGFSIIFEPFDSMAQTVFSPILRLYCMDASIALKSVFSYRSVIITSGTLSPMDFYCKILDFIPVKHKEIGIRLKRNCIGPLIVTKGNDQMMIKIGEESQLKNNMPSSISEKPKDNVQGKENVVSSSYSLRNDPSVIRNYGLLIIEFSKITPDGLVVFFPSYIFMEEIVSCWSELNIITEIKKNKLIFIETPDIKETEKALKLFKIACENGRGGVLFSVARGKVSEGVDFKNEHGRCVIVLGVPYQFTESIRLKKRLEYLNQNFGISSSEFLSFDAMRHAAQCLGRVLRDKNDYGLMIMADYRFEKGDRKKKLPKWILNCIEGGNTNLSIDMAVCIAKRFYREMAQPMF